MTQPLPTESTAAAAPATTEAIRSAVDAGFPAVVADLAGLVRIPSVSWPAFDPAHVAESAEAVAELLRGTGVFDLVEVRRALVEDGSELGQPAVVASRPARNGRPTVLLYAHHDVQPPGKDEDWETPPFEPTQRGDRLHGRGAADDKAGVMAHVGAIRAFAEASRRLRPRHRRLHRGRGGVGVPLVRELPPREPRPARRRRDHRRRLRQLGSRDSRDHGRPPRRGGVQPAHRHPRARLALRHVRGSRARRDARRRSGSSTRSGRPTAPSPSTGSRSADLETPEYDEAQLRAEAALLDGVSPIGDGTILSRIWAKPAITITGIDAPDVANASNTLVPGVRVRVSARIAPGQDAVEAFDAIRAHLEAHAPFGARLTFEDVDTGQAFLVDTSGWAVAETRAAMAEGWGREPVEIGVGGSIPFIAELVDEFPDAQILVTGVEDPDSRAHSPNESLHLGVFKRALLSEALFLARLDATRHDFLSKDRMRTPFRRLPWREVPRSLTHRGET